MGLLLELGYTRVRDFDGGIAEWVEAGHPIERDAAPLIAIGTAGASRPRAAPGPGRRASPLAWVASRSIPSLLTTWLLINLVCGVVYWLIAGRSAGDGRNAAQSTGNSAATKST